MTADQRQAFVARFTEGWAGGRDTLTRAMEGHVADDVLLTQPLAPPSRGIAGFHAQFKRLFGAIPDLTGEVHRWEPTPDGVTINMTFHGTVLGRGFALPNTDRIVLRDGLLAERHADFDPLALPRSLLSARSGSGGRIVLGVVAFAGATKLLAHKHKRA